MPSKPDSFDDAHFVEGEEEARKKVLACMKTLLDSTEVEAGFKVRLLMAGKGQESPVDSFNYDLSYDVKDFVEDVVDRAAQDVTNYRGAIKYAVRAFVNGREKRVVFRLNVPRTEVEEEDEFGDDDLDEAPTKRGIAHQSMRHAEVLMKEHRNGFTIVVKALQDQLNTRDNRIRELEARLREYQDREEDVASLGWVRGLETKRIENEENRKAEGLTMLKGAVPLLLQQFINPNGQQNPLGNLSSFATGGIQDGQVGSGHDGAPPHAPGGPSDHTSGPMPLDNLHVRQDLLLDSIFEQITMDHVRQMMQILPPTAVAALAELHACCQERHQNSSGNTGPKDRPGYGAEPHRKETRP